MPIKLSKTFYDCEHGGDISEITNIIHEHGGKVTGQQFNYEAEQLHLEWEVENAATFFDAVKGEYWFG